MFSEWRFIRGYYGGKRFPVWKGEAKGSCQSDGAVNFERQGELSWSEKKKEGVRKKKLSGISLIAWIDARDSRQRAVAELKEGLANEEKYFALSR